MYTLITITCFAAVETDRKLVVCWSASGDAAVAAAAAAAAAAGLAGLA